MGITEIIRSNLIIDSKGQVKDDDPEVGLLLTDQLTDQGRSDRIIADPGPIKPSILRYDFPVYRLAGLPKF